VTFLKFLQTRQNSLKVLRQTKLTNSFFLIERLNAHMVTLKSNIIVSADKPIFFSFFLHLNVLAIIK
jgi:hypothetical protein